VLVVRLGVTGLDALPVGLGGGAGVGAEAFQLGEQPGLGGGDAGQLGGQVCFLAGAGGGQLGAGGGDEVGEQGGAVTAEPARAGTGLARPVCGQCARRPDGEAVRRELKPDQDEVLPVSH
jgi:hypothetical protein